MKVGRRTKDERPKPHRAWLSSFSFVLKGNRVTNDIPLHISIMHPALSPCPPPLSPSPLALPETGTVHLWQFDLDSVAASEQTLSPDEHARAERLRLPLARTRFIAARGMLRATLARYTAEQPAALRFHYTSAGKPALAGPRNHKLSFNLTHSHNLALLAVTQSARIGVDLELIADADYSTIAQQFFAANELHALNALPPNQRRAAFYRCWVCKEAFIKARGEGLNLALDRFAVSVTPDEPAALLHVAGDAGEARHWQFATLTPAAGFVAALCVERQATIESP